MNKKLLVIIISTTLLLSSCSKINNSHNKITDSTEKKLELEQVKKLPENFTVDKVKSAFLEYINYRLWLYPMGIMDAVSDKQFDNYIEKSIDIEIRVYSSSDNSVYVHTNIGQWLAVFKVKNGYVYCDGQVSGGEYDWPSDIENYDVIEKYSMIIPQPHKPNYGTSQSKDKKIDAFEKGVKASLEDFYKGIDKCYDEWINVDVYVVDFYEYENGAYAWLCRRDGSIINYPVVFEEEINEIKIQTIKGYTLDNKNEFNEFGRFQFERDINDAVKYFKWSPKQ